MKNINNYKKFWIILSLLFLIDIAGYCVIVRPHRRELKDLKEMLHNKTENHKIKNIEVSTLPDSQTYVNRSREQIEKFNTILPDKDELARIIGELFSFIDKENMALKKVTYQPKQIREVNLLDYSANFTITGDYTSVKRLLNKIEWSTNLFSMKKLHLEKKHENGSIELNFTLSIFIRSNKGFM
jgi:Tfp pilus assembly protein PilO